MEIKMSTEINELVKALKTVQDNIENPKKDKKANPTFRGGYADLTQVWDSCRHLLAPNGLAVIQTPSINNGECTLITTLAHISGQWIAGELKLNPEKNTPQGFGSAITYARRYSLCAIIGIAPEDEDDDGEAAEGRNGYQKGTQAQKTHDFKPPAARKEAEPLGPEPTKESGKEDPAIKHWKDGDAKKGECVKCHKKGVFCYIDTGECYECHNG